MILQQGATRTIRVTDVKDSAGATLNLTGWTVHAMARPSWDSDVVYAEWHSTPTGSQGQATPSNGEITLAVPYAMSTSWTAWRNRTAKVHIEVTEPGVDGRRERFSTEIFLDPEVVR